MEKKRSEWRMYWVEHKSGYVDFGLDVSKEEAEEMFREEDYLDIHGEDILEVEGGSIA